MGQRKKPSSSLRYPLLPSKNQPPTFLKGFFFLLPLNLALTTLLLIFVYISITLNLAQIKAQTTLYLRSVQGSSSTIASIIQQRVSFPLHEDEEANDLDADSYGVARLRKEHKIFLGRLLGLNGSNIVGSKEAYHDWDMFVEDYKQMNKSFKIYVYPSTPSDPFANVLLPPDNSKIEGNSASEFYFKEVLSKSHFITNEPAKADLFYMPFSVSSMKEDPRIGIHGIPNFVQDYISNISRKYPYWNRTGGADHFYVACCSKGKIAMDKSFAARLNVIQLVCASSYFIPTYISHKDASMPLAWPRRRQLPPSKILASKRKKLAFFAGAVNSQVRLALLRVWTNDSDIFAHVGHVHGSYSGQLLSSKFCLHVKGLEVNTAHLVDALHHGCVPVVVANYFDLPFADILNWQSFSVVIYHVDIPVLKKILQGITTEEYLAMQGNGLRVRRHFWWNRGSVQDFDAFYMSMFQLWRRRSALRVALGNLTNGL